MYSLIARALQNSASLFESPAPEPAAKNSGWILLAILVMGAVLRFWGLDNTGLHREDEDTTALPALHILEDGTPRYPTGMFYARAISQSYMIAASVKLFGDSEWALRVPSVLCGILLIFLAYLLGRRFLSPWLNLAFTATVALFPALILMSQTARMYIFLLACITGYAILIFAWERSGRVSRLIAAVAVLILGLHFQALAIFSAFLVFFPALRNGDTRRFWEACVAFVVIVGAYVLIGTWVESFYPPQAPDSKYVMAETGEPTMQDLVPTTSIFWALFIGVVGVILAGWIARSAQHRLAGLAIGTMVLAAFVCQLALFYHLAALLYLVTAIVVLRHGRSALPALLVSVGVSAVLGLVQMWMLHSAGIESLRNIVGVMVGRPSVWTYVRVFEYSPGAALVCGLGLVFALWRIAQRRPIGEVWLVVFLWGLLPLFTIGIFAWMPAPRYIVMVLPPLLLGAFAAVQAASDWFATNMARSRRPVAALRGAAVVTVCILIIGPASFVQAIDAGYDVHPDHKGAAQYVKALELAPDDILIAEDVIAQDYYLDGLDYWLIGGHAGAMFVRPENGEYRDIYTGTPIIGTAEELKAVIDAPGRGDIYIIGSGENQADGRRFIRGEGIHRMMTSGAFEVVYTGRDGLTKVWKVPAHVPVP